MVKLPTGISVLRGRDGKVRGYRAWVPEGISGSKRWLPSQPTVEKAVLLRAAYLKRRGEIPPGRTLKEAFDLVEGEIERTRSEGYLRWFRFQKEAVLDRIPGETILSLMSTQQIQQFVSERSKEVSNSSVHHHLRGLRLVVKKGLREGWLRKDPMLGVKWPTAEQRGMSCFSREEIGKIVRWMETYPCRSGARDAAIVEFLFLTGLRRSELCRLNKEEVDSRTIRLVGKGQTYLRWRISESACRALERIPKIPSDNVLRLLFRRWQKRLLTGPVSLQGRRFSAHALRHSYVTALVEQGLSLPLVQRLARHKTTKMTLRYYHENQRDLDQGLEGLSLDN